jgi:hypothetical protein
VIFTYFIPLSENRQAERRKKVQEKFSFLPIFCLSRTNFSFSSFGAQLLSRVGEKKIAANIKRHIVVAFLVWFGKKIRSFSLSLSLSTEEEENFSPS